MSHEIPDEVERLLTSEPLMAHLATSLNDKPHVAPVWYDYADGVVELLTGGRKLENIRANPRVALSVQKDEAGRAKWKVTLLGTATIVDNPEEAKIAADRINPKYGADIDAYPENTLVRVDVGSATHTTY